MKITIYCYDHIKNPRCGGGGAQREYIIHKLLSQKHNIHLYSGNFPNAEEIKEGNFNIKFLGLKNNYLLSRISFSILATIHSLFVKTDIIVIEYSIYSPVFTFLVKPKKTIILFFHLTERNVFKKYNIFGIFPYIFEKIVIYLGKNYITLTEELASFLKRKRKNINIMAGFVGVDDSLFYPSTQDDNFILYLGRIDIWMKGIDLLITAYEKIAQDFIEYKLVIAGRGKERDIEWVKKRVKESIVSDRISLLTNIDEDKKKRLLQSCSFVVMPSRYEGWNIVAMEAAASSKATIGTKIHGLRDAIKDGETGFLVEPENIEDLSVKMRTLLANKELRDSLGKKGYIWVQHFTWEKISELQESFYLKVIYKQKNKILKIKR